MSKYPKHKLACAIAEFGDKAIPPETPMQAGTGRLSQRDGWGEYNSLPIGEGGIPPKRDDFNGAFYLLSQLLLWYQQGGVMKYDATLDYEVGNEVFQGANKYRCIKANGASTKPVTPGSDKKVWINLDAPSVIAGQVTAFVNCKLGGSDGRRLIPWGETQADERYVLCDGGSDGMGGNVPNLIGKFVLPCTIAEAGQTGGGQSVTTSSSKISGTISETVLTVDQIPSHTHSGRADSGGGHSHTRGNMNITGRFASYDRPGSAAVGASGALYVNGNYNANTKAAGGDDWGKWYNFDAARAWSGRTSHEGAHTHTVSVDATGGGRGHTHTLDGAEHTHTVQVQLPPFFKLAYFVKLPE